MYDASKSDENCIFYQFVGSFGHARTSGDMVGRFVPNSDLGGCSAGELSPSLCFFSAFIFLVLDILKYMRVYEGTWGLFKVYEGI